MNIGKTTIDFLGHSGFLITYKNESHEKRIAIDPYNLSLKEKADFILITHSHFDHCSLKDIEQIAKPGTTLIIPADVQSKITKLRNIRMELIELNEIIDLGLIKIEAVPSYNLNKKFHTKRDNFIGFIIKINNLIIYHAGDTDLIPEMAKLTGYAKKDNYFIALLPVSGKYVMTPEEAAEAATLIKPSLAIPMHYGAGVAGTEADAELFVKICKEKGINAQILPKTS